MHHSSLICSLVLSFTLAACAQSTPKSTPDSNTSTVMIAPREQVEAQGKKWMISTQGKHTTRIANQVMKNGGNLIDAAIAASFAISVERPHSTGLGGGGFLIYHEAKTGKNYVYDFRERAPLKSKKKMFLNTKGEVIPDLSIEGSLAVATPGLVKGLAQIHQRFGKQKWKSLVEPSIKLAHEGFPIYSTLAKALESEQETLKKYPSSHEIFLHADHTPKKLNELLVQEDLAQTLIRISKNPNEFYSGKTAQQMVATVKKYHGILSMKDLAHYTVKQRKALEADWKGYHLVSMPPPSSGGIHVIQILKLLETEPLTDPLHGFLNSKSLHLTASAMQLAFADRAVHLGDPDFVKVPIQGLLDEKYLKQRHSLIDPTHALPMAKVSAGKPQTYNDSENTTHFSMMDDSGNVVVSTQTINGWFGSGVVAEKTGIVLNNEMDDFSAKPGAANLFGAVGGDANAVAPQKTPLSSMSPTIVFKNKIPVLAIGAPGGTRIITGVAQAILNHLLYQKDLYTSIAAPRIHQQWTPDVLTIEGKTERGTTFVREDISDLTVSELQAMGWTVKRGGAQCNVMAVSRTQTPDGKPEFVGVADPRDIGTSAGELTP